MGGPARRLLASQGQFSKDGGWCQFTEVPGVSGPYFTVV